MTLDPKLQKFTTASPIVASFPSEQIASGISQVTMFGIASADDSGITYQLILNSDMFSARTGTDSTGTTEINFDSAQFALPRTAKGTATFSCAIGGGAGDTATVTVQIIHVDSASSETTISAAIVSETVTLIGSSTGSVIFLDIPITTEKLFRKGDKLRLEVIFTRVSGAATETIGHDPKNQDADSIIVSNGATTVLRFIMSYRAEA